MASSNVNGNSVGLGFRLDDRVEGVTVEEVTPVRVRERSAAAGGSSSASEPEARPAWRVKVRMPDGSVQVRDLDRREFRPGDHVLLTNAGDVVPD